MYEDRLFRRYGTPEERIARAEAEMSIQMGWRERRTQSMEKARAQSKGHLKLFFQREARPLVSEQVALELPANQATCDLHRTKHGPNSRGRLKLTDINCLPFPLPRLTPLHDPVVSAREWVDYEQASMIVTNAASDEWEYYATPTTRVDYSPWDGLPVPQTLVEVLAYPDKLSNTPSGRYNKRTASKPQDKFDKSVAAYSWQSSCFRTKLENATLKTINVEVLGIDSSSLALCLPWPGKSNNCYWLFLVKKKWGLLSLLTSPT